MSAVQGKFPNSAYWFNQMYYGTNSAFRRSRAGRGLAFPSNVLSVRGFMEGNTYHSILNISVTPTRYCQNSPSRGVSCFLLLLFCFNFLGGKEQNPGNVGFYTPGSHNMPMSQTNKI